MEGREEEVAGSLDDDVQASQGKEKEKEEEGGLLLSLWRSLPLPRASERDLKQTKGHFCQPRHHFLFSFTTHNRIFSSLFPALIIKKMFALFLTVWFFL